MNGGPYRAPQPSDRRVINRSESAPSASYRLAEESQPVSRDEPKPTYRTPASQYTETPKRNASKRPVLIGSIIAAIVILALAAFVLVPKIFTPAAAIDASRYQAVFLTNGQIYFGKLALFNEESFKITRVYYPEAQAKAGEDSQAQNQTSAQGNIKLIPITDGVHGTDDEMVVMKSQILYYENLKSDSQVSRLIEQSKR